MHLIRTQHGMLFYALKTKLYTAYTFYSQAMNFTKASDISTLAARRRILRVPQAHGSAVPVPEI